MKIGYLLIAGISIAFLVSVDAILISNLFTSVGRYLEVISLEYQESNLEIKQKKIEALLFLLMNISLLLMGLAASAYAIRHTVKVNAGESGNKYTKKSWSRYVSKI